MDRVTDPIFPMLQYPVKHSREAPHARTMVDIINALLITGFDILNYDHVNLTIPKVAIDLKLEGRRYDIVAWKDDYIVYIEVKTRKMTKRELEGVLKHGKGEK